MVEATSTTHDCQQQQPGDDPVTKDRGGGH